MYLNICTRCISIFCMRVGKQFSQSNAWPTRNPGFPSFPSIPSMPGGPFQCKHVWRTQKSIRFMDSLESIELRPSAYHRGKIIIQIWHVYHQPWGARWSWGSNWSLRALRTIITLKKKQKENRFSVIQVRISNVKKQQLLNVIFVLTFSPLIPGRPSLPGLPPGPGGP